MNIAIKGDTQFPENEVILKKFNWCYLDLDMIVTNDTGECGIVQINDNKTTFSSMECSNKAAILCFGEWIFFLVIDYNFLIEIISYLVPNFTPTSLIALRQQFYFLWIVRFKFLCQVISKNENSDERLPILMFQHRPCCALSNIFFKVGMKQTDKSEWTNKPMIQSRRLKER